MWLLILQTCSRPDRESAHTSLANLRQHKYFEPVIILSFGPTMDHCPELFLMTKHKIDRLSNFSCGSSHTLGCGAKQNRIHAIRACVRFLTQKNVDFRFDKILFWGHGASWVVGTWKKPDEFLSIDELNDELFVPFQPKLIVFEACYMGSLACLFSMHSSIKYIVASPGLQPYCSFMDLSKFFRSPLTTKQQDLKEYAIQLANQWMEVAREQEKESCMLVFDVRYVQRVIAPLIKQNWATMMFDKRAQVHRVDARVFDIWSATRHLPDLQNKIRKSILNVPQKKPIPCWRVRGMTVDSKIIRKWSHLYDQCRWAKFLGKHHKRYHTVPKVDSRARTHYKYGQWLPNNLSKKQKTS